MSQAYRGSIMKNKIFLLAVIFILFPLASWSYPHDMEIFNSDKFARPEMKNMCSVCHVSPSGGGPLNNFGKTFEANNEIITNDIRKKFPELFDLLKATSPRITRVKPSVFIVGKETKVTILGLNFSSSDFLHIDNVSLESTPQIEHTAVNSKKIELTITFDKPGKHTFHIVNALGQVSNVLKVVAKPAK